MPAQRGQRAARACDFCKRRKLKCGNESPKCGNCSTHDRECVYSQVQPKRRPTNAIIAELEEENWRLRSRHVSASPQGPPTNSSLPRTPATQPGANSEQTPRSLGLAASPTETYHGPTSTLFDETSVRKEQPKWLSSSRESAMPRLLFAEAAKQRQMETVNSHEGNLDFDGVDPELGLHLLNLHWNRQHHSFLVTYRPAFMRDMACDGPYFSKILLNAIYYGASKFSTRLEVRKDHNDVRTAGWQFRQRVRDLLGPALDHSSITTIQALLQMTNSLFAIGDEQSAAWLYAGIAFRMITDLGLHVDATLLPNMHSLSDEDLEIRRRVFWSGFVIDKIQSLYQGRAAALQAVDCQVPIAFNDDYEELEHWMPFAYTSGSSYSGSCSYSVSTFVQLCRLCVILNRILNEIYKDSDAMQDPSKMSQVINGLESDLTTWSNELPQHLRLDLATNTTTLPPHVLSLLLMSNVIRILLRRPMVSDGQLHSASPTVALESFRICATAATAIVKICRLYNRAFKIQKAPYLVSYSTYVAATIHVRIAATGGVSSEAYECLTFCLRVFDQNSETNNAVRKAELVIRNLMERMGVTDIPNNNPQSPSTPPSRDQAATSVATTSQAASMPPHIIPTSAAYTHDLSYSD